MEFFRRSLVFLTTLVMAALTIIHAVPDPEPHPQLGLANDLLGQGED
ncbi:hypothetical protein X975_10616, partial [Stegodyphus mimosarum]